MSTGDGDLTRTRTSIEDYKPLAVTGPRLTMELSVAEIVAQTRKIQEAMAAVMIEGEHYGVIPGTGKKRTLYKPGAEKLCLLFRFAPECEIVASTETAELIRFTIRCVLIHFPTGQRIATGLGSCNSREEKYRRPAAKKCPTCEAPAIFRSKRDPGWYCWGKKGGCGAQFSRPDEIAAIEGQDAGLADPADLHNTILKMACKRSLIAAVLNATAASDCFAQDLEDLPPQLLDAREDHRPAARAQAAPPPAEPEPEDGDGDGDGFEGAVRAELVEENGIAEKLEASVMVDVLDPKTGEVIGREPKASRQQVVLAHVLKDWLHVSDEVWRKRLLKRTGYDSSGKLCARIMSELIDEMQEKKSQRERRAAEATEEMAAHVGERASGIPEGGP